jgi:glycosyltransferase involved in cell wall biosynthesis
MIADTPLEQPWPKVEVLDLPRRFNRRVVRFIPWARWTRQAVSRWQADVLHAHRVSSGGWLGAASGFHPLIVTPWGSDVYQHPQRSLAARLLAWFTLRRADLITANSDAIGRQAIKLGGRAQAVQIIQFGVEMDVFSPAPATPVKSAALRQRLSLPPDARLVLSVRGVKPVYNLEIILQALPAVRQQFPEAIFIFRNYNTDPAYKQQIDALTAELGLGDFIRWLPEVNDRTEMAALYRLSEVVVSVPTTDGTPVSVQEAMACEKPIVCTDLPSLREFITHGQNGFLVPVRQPAPLAEAINQLLAGPELGRAFGRRNRQIIAEKANAEAEMQLMETIYYRLSAVQKG